MPADPKKVRAIEEFLRSSFGAEQIRHTERDINAEFFVDDGPECRHIVIARSSIDDHDEDAILKHLVGWQLVDTARANPRKTLYVGDHGISVSEA